MKLYRECTKQLPRYLRHCQGFLPPVYNSILVPSVTPLKDLSNQTGCESDDLIIHGKLETPQATGPHGQVLSEDETGNNPPCIPLFAILLVCVSNKRYLETR
jgi:hypothetical protein